MSSSREQSISPSEKSTATLHALERHELKLKRDREINLCRQKIPVVPDEIENIERSYEKELLSLYEKQATSLTKEHIQLREKQREQDCQIEALHTELSAARKLAPKLAEQQALQNQKEEYAARLKILKQQLRAERESNEALLAELNKINSAHPMLVSPIAKEGQQVLETSNIAKLPHENAGLQKKLDLFITQKSTLEKQLSKNVTEITTQHDFIMEMREKNGKLNQEVLAQQTTLDQLREQQESLTTKLRNTTHDHEVISLEIKQLITKNTNLSTELDCTKFALADLKKVHIKNMQTIQILQKDKDNQLKYNRILEEKCATHSNELSQYKESQGAVLAAAQKLDKQAGWKLSAVAGGVSLSAGASLGAVLLAGKVTLIIAGVAASGGIGAALLVVGALVAAACFYYSRKSYKMIENINIVNKKLQPSPPPLKSVSSTYYASKKLNFSIPEPGISQPQSLTLASGANDRNLSGISPSPIPAIVSIPSSPTHRK